MNHRRPTSKALVLLSPILIFQLAFPAHLLAQQGPTPEERLKLLLMADEDLTKAQTLLKGELEKTKANGFPRDADLNPVTASYTDEGLSDKGKKLKAFFDVLAKVQYTINVSGAPQFYPADDLKEFFGSQILLPPKPGEFADDYVKFYLWNKRNDQYFLAFIDGLPEVEGRKPPSRWLFKSHTPACPAIPKTGIVAWFSGGYDGDQCLAECQESTIRPHKWVTSDWSPPRKSSPYDDLANFPTPGTLSDMANFTHYSPALVRDYFRRLASIGVHSGFTSSCRCTNDIAKPYWLMQIVPPTFSWKAIINTTEIDSETESIKRLQEFIELLKFLPIPFLSSGLKLSEAILDREVFKGTEAFAHLVLDFTMLPGATKVIATSTTLTRVTKASAGFLVLKTSMEMIRDAANDKFSPFKLFTLALMVLFYKSLSWSVKNPTLALANPKAATRFENDIGAVNEMLNRREWLKSLEKWIEGLRNKGAISAVEAKASTVEDAIKLVFELLKNDVFLNMRAHAKKAFDAAMARNPGNRDKALLETLDEMNRVWGKEMGALNGLTPLVQSMTSKGWL